MDLGNLTQRLADLHVSTIVWFVVALTVVRIALVRFTDVRASSGETAASAQAPTARVVVEIVEAALIAAVLVFMLIQPFLVKAFYIPSGSMIPTLIDNDHILVNRFEYRMEQPRREDVIVFAAPAQALKVANEQPSPDGDPIDYIKRLMGLPGDTIQVVRGYVRIGSHTYTHADLASQFGVNDITGDQHVKIEDNGVGIFDGTAWKTYTAQDVAQKMVEYPTRVEFHPGYVLRNGVKLVEPYIAEDPDYDMKIVDGHSLLFDPNGAGSTYKLDGEDLSPEQYAAYDKEPAGRVPPGHVFAMGDNRNQSSDSTRWGPLVENRVVGKAFFIFYPFDRIRVIH